MQVEQLSTASGAVIEGPLLIKPQIFGDDRGFFFESWNQQSFAAALEADGQPIPSFVQDNHSRSSRGVLRGLHYQLPPHPQGKLVRCVLGEIFDVAVDIRHGSPTCGHWVGARLSAENHQQLWVPVGFAHGFLTLSEHAEVLYKTTDFWSREWERSLRWDDPELAITWPLEALAGALPQLSEKDAAAPLLAEVGEELLGCVWSSVRSVQTADASRTGAP
jgi:dTDP-4-dehydrorhamnose 3,5-epimerase